MSLKFQLHQKSYLRVSFSQFSLTKSQASKYPGKFWLTVAMICESSCDLMISPSRLFCISLGDRAYAKTQEEKHLFICSHGFSQSPQLVAKDDIIHEANNFGYLEEINTIFYYSKYIYLALISRNQSDFSSNPST